MSKMKKTPGVKIIRKPNGAPIETANNHATPVAGFEINGGVIAFDPDMSNVTDRQLGCLVMASFGFSNSEIGSNLFLTENTIKTTVANGAEKEGIENQRATFARHFFDTGVFRLVKPGQSLRLTEIRRQIIKLASLGKTNNEIATDIHRDPETIKTTLSAISRRTGLRGREQMIVGALVSREIGDYPLYDINLSQPTSWTENGGLIVPEPRVPTPQEAIHERN